MIVELNGTSLQEARSCARRFLERTNGVASADAPNPRPYKISDIAVKLERQRMRAKVAGTRKLRVQLLAILDAWRSKVVDAVRKCAQSHTREADVADVDAELNQAVDAGVLTDQQRQDIIDALNAALASMDPKQVAIAIAQVQKELFDAGLASAKNEVGLTWDVPPQTALAQLAQTVIPFSQDIVDREIAAIKIALQDGIDAGDGIPQLAQRIQDTFDDGMHVLDDDGNVTRVIPSDAWAELVARTETARAMNAGIMQAYHAAGVARIMWIASEDERTCPVCADLDGQVILMGDEFDDGVTAPPDHPLCRCTVVSAAAAATGEGAGDQDVAA